MIFSPPSSASLSRSDSAAGNWLATSAAEVVAMNWRREKLWFVDMGCIVKRGSTLSKGKIWSAKSRECTPKQFETRRRTRQGNRLRQSLIPMDDPIERMRKAFEEVKALVELDRFARKSEEDRLERDWNDFVNRAVRPAFDEVREQFFGAMFGELEEKSGNAGFSAQDFPNTEFWFWIELRGRKPLAQARRRYGKSTGARVIPTKFFGSNSDLDIADVNKEIGRAH